MANQATSHYAVKRSPAWDRRAESDLILRSFLPFFLPVFFPSFFFIPPRTRVLCFSADILPGLK